MSARSSGAGAFALAAVLAACALSACGDSTRLAAPPAPAALRAVAPPAADTTYLPAARVRARALALALAAPAARASLRDALRRSPLATHRLTMESELARPRSAPLVRALARGAGVADDSLRALFARGPALDLLLPRASDRRGWRPDRPVWVAVADRRRADSRVAYAPSGDSAATPAPGAAYLLLTPAGDRSRRVGAQPDAAGDAVEDPDDGSLSGTLSFVAANGDTTRIDVADLISDYRTLPLSAPVADRDRVLGELRAARAARAATASPARAAAAGQRPRRLVACVDVCDGGSLIGWRDTTYLVAFYKNGDPEVGADATYEPWFDGYYRGSKWRLQFDGVPGRAVIYVDLPFMPIRMADHSAATIKVIGGEDNGWWSDGACVATGMKFAGARYVRSGPGLAVTLVRPDTYTWRHCGGYEGADTWGAQLRWTPRSRPVATSLSVELDTTYMTALSLDLPYLYTVEKYKGAYRYAYSGCPSLFYIRGFAADGEPLDTTSLAVLATTSSSDPAIGEPVRPMNGALRNYAPGTVTLTATVDGVTASAKYGVMQYISGIAVSPGQSAVAPGAAVTERVTWTGSTNGACALPYTRPAALRPTWSSSSPALVVTPTADSSVVTATPTAAGSFTLTATVGPLTSQATVVGVTPPTTAPVVRGAYTTQGGRVSWTAISGATGYTVYRRVDGGAWQPYLTTSGTGFIDPTSVDYAYAGASPGTAGTEDFEVLAWNAGGTGPMSNVVGFKLSTATGGGGSGGGGGGGGTMYSRGSTSARPFPP